MIKRDSDIKCPQCGVVGTHTVNKSLSETKKSLKCSGCGGYFLYYLPTPETAIVSDKKIGEYSWRERCELNKTIQEFHEKSSWSQDSALISLTTELPYIIFYPMADTHIGSIGVDYESIVEITDYIIRNPFIYTALVGDITDNFGSFKNALPVLSQIMSPDEQDTFAESWLIEISQKVLFATWGNHSAFSERANGKNEEKKLLNHHMIYFNGIGVSVIEINGIRYKIAATHKTRGNSSFNKTHGLKRLAREDIPDADIYLGAHTHNPSIEQTHERGLLQTFAVLDSAKVNDGFAKRGFSYWHNRMAICFVLNTQEKEVLAFKSIKEALHYVRYDEYVSKQAE